MGHCSMTRLANTPEKIISRARPNGDCIEWTGYCGPSGYGESSLGNEHVRVHQVAWKYYTAAEIPAGFEIMHTCDNRKCIKREHLKLGTHKDNMEDAANKGRMGSRSRKPKRNGIITVSIGGTLNDVKEIAQAENRSINRQVAVIIREWLAARKQQKKSVSTNKLSLAS